MISESEQKPKILVVDDEPDLISGLERILLMHEFEVESASNGEDAVSKNLSWKPDAIIMDIRMPRLNGIDACLEIQRTRPGVKVILMTGFSEAIDEANDQIFGEASRNQVELMIKPLDPARVVKLLTTDEGDSKDAAGFTTAL